MLLHIIHRFASNLLFTFKLINIGRHKHGMDSHEYILLKEIIRGIPELVIVVSENGEYLEIGGISVHNPEDIVGRSLAELFPSHITALFETALSDAFSAPNSDVKTIEYQLSPSADLKIPLTNNETRTFQLKINPLSTLWQKQRIAVCICRDITESRRHEQKLLSMSEQDPLTGIYNRKKLFERLEVAFQEYRRYATPASFMLLDLDNFKTINDGYGHQAGDKAICHFVNILECELRAVDTFARLGGDEFGFLMPQVTYESALKLAERIKFKINQHPFIYQGSTIPISVSIGISQFNRDDHEIQDLICRADQAMYQSKHQGKNSISIYQTCKNTA